MLALRSLRRRYDLVHVHNMPDVLVFSALVPKLLGAKVILDLHDPMPELMMSIFGLSGTSMAVRLLHGFERLSTRFADCVLTPNVAFENLFASRTCPKEKIRVIMNSPDEKIFALRKPEPAQSPRADRPFVMMFHGALVERHGLDLAVSALESVLRQVPGAQLRVYGKRTPFLEKVLKGLPARGPGGLEKAVLYCGPKSLEQIAAAISGCDLGLIPNRKSAFTALNMPTRIFEYLACGKPVIAPRTRGIQDYLSAGEVVFFDPDKPEDLAEQILRVYSNPGEVEAMVLRGQQVYLEHRWSKERERFCNLALDLLGVPSPSTL